MTESTYDDTKRIASLSGGQKILRFHTNAMCADTPCPVHNPSDHEYRDLPLFWGVFGPVFHREDGERHILDPDDYNLRTRGEVIVRNSVLCLECGGEIESHGRHHYVKCPCGTVAADGGHDYLKRSSWNMEANFKDTSIICTPENLVIE